MSTIPVRDDTRNASQPPLGICPMCDTLSDRRPQHLLHAPIAANGPFDSATVGNQKALTALAAKLRRQQRLVAQTVSQCPAC